MSKINVKRGQINDEDLFNKQIIISSYDKWAFSKISLINDASDIYIYISWMSIWKIFSLKKLYN